MAEVEECGNRAERDDPRPGIFVRVANTGLIPDMGAASFASVRMGTAATAALG
jgi:hypothetical protein